MRPNIYSYSIHVPLFIGSFSELTTSCSFWSIIAKHQSVFSLIVFLRDPKSTSCLHLNSGWWSESTVPSLHSCSARASFFNWLLCLVRGCTKRSELSLSPLAIVLSKVIMSAWSFCQPWELRCICWAMTSCQSTVCAHACVCVCWGVHVCLLILWWGGSL